MNIRIPANNTAGIPTIIKPFFGDQAFWAERVESLNVGSAIRKLTSEHLADALKKATTDEKQIAKAKIVGEMIRKVGPYSEPVLLLVYANPNRRTELPKLSRRFTAIW